MNHLIKEIVQLAHSYQKALPSMPALLPPPSGKELARTIDHTLLKTEATKAQILNLCQEALEYQFASVCVNPAYISLAADVLKDSTVRVCSVLGFPLGAHPPLSKVAEAATNLALGAQELDMVINVGALKSEDYETVFRELNGVVQVAHSEGAVVKVIIECGLLTTFEKILACLLIKEAKADFVKTSTGMMAGGATVEDVELMTRVVEGKIGVKAAGGIRSYAEALSMLNAGATRIGSSAGVKIMKEALS